MFVRGLSVRRMAWCLEVSAAGCLCVWAMLLSGCKAADVRCPDDPVSAATSRDEIDFGRFNRVPKGRIGCLPCTGMFTLFTTADPNRLGTHSYTGTSAHGGGERQRGIVYTTYGGFLDIAHLRKAADWTAYHKVRIQYALENDWGCIILQCKEPSVYHMKLNYPANWDAMSEGERAAVIEEASIRIAQRLVVIQTTWHEIMTWFGYASLAIVSEKGSAFTYEDTTSHILGARVAGMALREPLGNFDTGVTRHLNRELRELGAVSPSRALQAIAAVEGDWWVNGKIVKRQIDMGEDDGIVQPWIVKGFGGVHAPKVEPFRIATLDNVRGQDLSQMVSIEIKPRVPAWGKMRRLLPGRPDRCDPDKHFEILMDYIRVDAAPLRVTSAR